MKRRCQDKDKDTRSRLHDRDSESLRCQGTDAGYRRKDKDASASGADGSKQDAPASKFRRPRIQTDYKGQQGARVHRERFTRTAKRLGLCSARKSREGVAIEKERFFGGGDGAEEARRTTSGPGSGSCPLRDRDRGIQLPRLCQMMLRSRLSRRSLVGATFSLASARE